MIFEVLISILSAVIIFLFGLVAIPAAPLAFTNAITLILPYMSAPIVIMQNLVGPEFFNIIMNLTVALVIFRIGYQPLMWLLSKMKVLGAKE